jgi:hypothetical protein
VKAFRFRLEQALRWRATQVDLEKSQVALAANRLAAIRADVESRRKELNDGALKMAAGVTGSALACWAPWADRTRRQIVEFEKKTREAECVLAARMRLLVEANQKKQVLENLEATERDRWQGELGRELEAFASEAFLGRLQSKSGRARSSGG